MLIGTRTTRPGGHHDDTAKFSHARRGRLEDRRGLGRPGAGRKARSTAGRREHGAGDFANRDRRPEPEFPALRRQPEEHLRPELRAGKHAGRVGIGRLHGGGAPGRRTAIPFPLASNSFNAGAAGDQRQPGQRQARLRSDRAAVHLPVPARRERGAWRENAEGVRRLRQSAPRAAQLGLARCRHRRPSGDRVAAQAHGHPGPARALSRHDAATDGHRSGHAAIHLRHAW